MAKHDWTDNIANELERLCKVKGEQSNTIDLNAYGIGVLSGLNSPLITQICEVEKLEAKIEVLKDFFDMWIKNKNFTTGAVVVIMSELEQTRDKLLSEIKHPK